MLIPNDIISPLEAQPLLSPPNKILLEACVTDDMISAINELLALNRYLVKESIVRNVWKDGPIAGFHAIPVLHKLLSAQKGPITANAELARQEACRIGALLYVVGLRKRFGVNVTLDIYRSRLKDIMKFLDSCITQTKDSMLLWVLFLGGIHSIGYTEHEWFIATITQIIVRWGLSSWAELMVMLRNVLWIDGFMEQNCNEFRGELAAELESSYERVFS